MEAVTALSPSTGGFSCVFLLVQMSSTGPLITWAPLGFSGLSGTAQCSQAPSPLPAASAR